MSSKQLYLILIVIFSGCNSNPRKYVATVKHDNMSATIYSFSEVLYVQSKDVKREDIVAIRKWRTYKFIPDDTIEFFRVIAIPGDSLEIMRNQVYVNGKLRNPSPSEMRRYYIKFRNTDIPNDILREDSYRLNDSTFTHNLTQTRFRELSNSANVDSITELVVSPDLKGGENGHHSFLPAIRIPKINETLNFDYPLPLIGQSKTKGTTIKSRYYFLMNDNFWSLPDSRGFGLCPADSILGVVTDIIPALTGPKIIEVSVPDTTNR